MTAVSIGPFVFSTAVFIVAVTLLSTAALAWWLEKKYAVHIESRIWLTALVGVLVSRAAFVVQYWEQYYPYPFSILDIRDGGFAMHAGVIAAVLTALCLGYSMHGRQRKMFTLCVTVAAVVGATAGLWLAPHAAQRQSVPVAIELSNPWAESIAEQTVMLGDLTSQPMVINLWASWCPPCRREMPVFEAAQHDYPHIHFLYANQQESAKTVERFLAQQQLGLEQVLLDPHAQLARFAESRGLPTTLFVNRDGSVQAIRMGELSRASLTHYLEQLR